MKMAAFLFSIILSVCASALAKEAQQEPLKELPYTEAELLGTKARTTYEGDYLNLVAFPMGGIGSGCVSLAGTGKLVDWEIFNKANKGYQPIGQRPRTKSRFSGCSRDNGEDALPTP
jgi:hypothetical protein